MDKRRRRSAQGSAPLVFDEGIVVSRKSTDAVDEQEKFKMYYEYSEPVKDNSIASHVSHTARRS